MTMIETAAKAAYTAMVGRLNFTGANLCSWEEQTEVLRDDWRTAARAAVEAMRKPSDKMIRHMEFTGDSNMMECPTIGWQCATKLWAAGIDAALEEGK